LASAHIDLKKGVDAGLLQQEVLLRESLQTKADHRVRLLGERKNESQLLALNKEIDETLTQYKAVEAQIRTTSPAYAALTQPQSLTVREVQQKLLDDDTILLEYSLGKEHSYVFVVAANSLTVHELPRQAEIESLARKVYGLLAARSRVPEGET